MADPVADLASRLSVLNPVATDAALPTSSPEAAASASAISPAPSTSAPTAAAPVDASGNQLVDAVVDGVELEEEEEDIEASSLLDSLANEIQVTLADQQLDPNSPLFSVQSFEDLHLHENLLKGVYKMGFQKPSKIQERALPLLLQNPPQNMIGQSQSGTGKTAAFVLTMLSRVDMDLHEPQAICIAPSRELALQIMSVVQAMGVYTPVKCFFAGRDTVTRGMPPVKDHIIVGTPGTLIDMITKSRVLSVSKIAVFVLDEADNMLDQGTMGEQSIQVKSLIMKFSKSPQIILFSATFADSVRNFATKFAPNANEIRLKQQDLSLAAIKQFFMDCANEAQKYDVLVELYNLLTIGQSIIFVKRRDTADRIAARMTAEGHKVVSLHGKLETFERDTIMDSFRDGKTKVLVTTNVIARGIDVMQVNMVVNYDLPLDVNNQPDPETYLHRIGRTGRFGRKGVSINFVHDARSFQDMTTIEKALGTPIVRVDTSDLEKMESTLKAAMKA